MIRTCESHGVAATSTASLTTCEISQRFGLREVGTLSQ